MKAFRQFVSRYQIVVFYVLACATSWSIVPLSGGRLLPHGPMFAAMIVLGITMGRRGLADLWRQATRWRVRWTWFLVAPGIIVAFHLGAFTLNLALGATVSLSPQLRSWPAFLVNAGMLLLVGGLWEEPGWSGYALPHLWKRFAGRSQPGRFAATMIVAVLRALWHLPLVLYGHIPWYELVFYNLAFQLTISWMYERTGGSVPVVMLFHLASNLVWSVMLPMFSGADQTRYCWLSIGLATMIALALTWHNWAGSPTRRTSEERLAFDSAN